jgi:hypothetical protein
MRRREFLTSSPFGAFAVECVHDPSAPREGSLSLTIPSGYHCR